MQQVENELRIHMSLILNELITHTSYTKNTHTKAQQLSQFTLLTNKYVYACHSCKMTSQGYLYPNIQTLTLYNNYKIYPNKGKLLQRTKTIKVNFDFVAHFDFAFFFTLSTNLWSRIQSDFAPNNLPLWIRDHKKN